MANRLIKPDYALYGFVYFPLVIPRIYARMLIDAGFVDNVMGDEYTLKLNKKGCEAIGVSFTDLQKANI